MTVLIAEDDPDQLEIRSMLLAQSGFKTIGASDSGAALKAAASQRPDCAIVDWKFPTEALGLRLIRELKALHPSLRVLVLTGGDPERFRLLPESRLVEEVLLKGGSSQGLLKALNQPKEQPLSELRNALARTGSVTFDVKAIPRCTRSEVVGLATDGAVKIRLAAVAEKGKANDELRAVLADCFAVPKSHVELILGETSQRKRVRVSA